MGLRKICFKLEPTFCRADAALLDGGVGGRSGKKSSMTTSRAAARTASPYKMTDTSWRIFSASSPSSSAFPSSGRGGSVTSQGKRRAGGTSPAIWMAMMMPVAVVRSPAGNQAALTTVSVPSITILAQPLRPAQTRLVTCKICLTCSCRVVTVYECKVIWDRCLFMLFVDQSSKHFVFYQNIVFTFFYLT